MRNRPRWRNVARRLPHPRPLPRGEGAGALPVIPAKAGIQARQPTAEPPKRNRPRWRNVARRLPHPPSPSGRGGRSPSPSFRRKPESSRVALRVSPRQEQDGAPARPTRAGQEALRRTNLQRRQSSVASPLTPALSPRRGGRSPFPSFRRKPESSRAALRVSPRQEQDGAPARPTRAGQEALRRTNLQRRQSAVASPLTPALSPRRGGRICPWALAAPSIVPRGCGAEPPRRGARGAAPHPLRAGGWVGGPR